MDKYRIDSHKIMYHPERLAKWLGGLNDWEKAKKVYPIYVEITSSGACNHRCRFCALDYLGYKSGFANFNNLKKAIKDMARGGVKSIQFGGEGEPLLHPRIPELIQYAKSLGIDVSLLTNGALLRGDFLKASLSCLTWLKVSIDAGTPETHLKIHRPKVQDYHDIIANLKNAVKIKKETKSQCTLGSQFIILPDNFHEALTLAKTIKQIGFDYLILKPYSQHKKSITREYEGVDYKKYFYLENKLKKLSDDNFKLIFRRETMENLAWEKNYKICHAVPFLWAYLMANGDVYSCSSFLGDKEFKLGNYNKNSFKEIWEGEKRRRHWHFVKNKLNIGECRENCRMDKINNYLENLNNPPDHVNFI